MIAKVEPLTTARSLAGPFDYLVSPSLGQVGVGSVLQVPFGRRRVLGVVVAVAEDSEVPPERLVEPLAALEEDVPAELVKLGLWVAREYCSTPARGLALVLPPGTGTGARRVRARRRLVAQLAGSGDRTGLGVRQQEVLELLAGGPTAVAELPGGHASLKRLEDRGLVKLSYEQTRTRPELAAVGATADAGALTGEQKAALAQVEAALDAPGECPPLLLHGVTASGKTEVYLRAAAATLERGGSAIVLVPEIALTPQTAVRFVQRFGDAVAVLHSRLSARERYDEWARLRSGEARVCVGPRSAVFAPVERLGLIVVDEEHDASYKQEGDPRYDARHVAEQRAAEARAVLLAGSATPRPESRHRYRRIVLPTRIDGRPLPEVELLAARGPEALHERTREALAGVRDRGEKAIVLLNRRGWSNFLSCRVCGRAWGCPDCDVTLVLHRRERRVACHHCGHSEAVPHACPDCGSVSVARHGAGTERLELELEALVAPLPVLRLDTDTATSGAGAGEILRRFDLEPASVLVGTQMVAKGHDFPEVTLGVVVDADATLRFPDFRAEERTFSLVAQLAGRSGRGERPGRVIVQALDPEAPALRHAAAHDSEGFLAAELARRELLRYPPFGHLIRVVCSSEEPGPELAAAQAVRSRIDAPGAAVLGPAPLFRRAGRERAQLVVKAGERSPVIAAVRSAVEAAAADRSLRDANFAVDVDPQ
jgi:primosomal protein N' (replication factor Y) (superfamily II helicase)